MAIGVIQFPLPPRYDTWLNDQYYYDQQDALKWHHLDKFTNSTARRDSDAIVKYCLDQGSNFPPGIYDWLQSKFENLDSDPKNSTITGNDDDVH